MIQRRVEIRVTDSLRAALLRYMEKAQITCMDAAVAQLVVYALIDRGCY